MIKLQGLGLGRLQRINEDYSELRKERITNITEKIRSLLNSL